ncbi:TetR/AcrR family transcriptional regulator [Larsenimonas suaedae]|uniref:TetR/AcrR family transcriptional regulator n=2 Tax=Larsenimonas suaedae TaxID=1851019 RepID=A0ABU1GTE4_9GAMM|nr:TetR/AcrR family transcriptional regulator [Larsenimonas suaedae]MDR5895294.1 TetR/AcrR family transcriptional regulator [Larsenimonas suaedae]
MDTKKGIIRQKNMAAILYAAETIFSEKGYAGATMGDIAERAELPKSNLHYYFSTKAQLYREVLTAHLALWEQDALCFEYYDDPQVVLTTYIRAKMTRSRTRPYGSKVWANEVMHRAPLMSEEARTRLVEWAKLKEAKIAGWVERGAIAQVSPPHLLYMIWASTQHYADFDYQIELLNDRHPLDDVEFERAIQTVTRVILGGLGLRV